MDAKEKTLTTFSTRVRQLILQFRELKAENNELYAMVDERDKKIKELESQVAQKQTEYESLKTAKMLEITAAVVKAVNIPVTVKTRLGWDKSSINVCELARAAEENGASAIAVHGRTKTMLYSGNADWDAIKKVTLSVSIPVIANGDIFSPEDALRCQMHSGASLFMLGRAAFGDPWIFAQVRAALNGEEIPERPPLAERMDVALKQFQLACEDKGEHIACLEARKHFAWYLRGVSHSAFYKEQISRLSTPEEVHAVAKAIKRDLR